MAAASPARPDASDEPGPVPSTLHWLPCSIGMDGPAPVGAYFRPAATGEREGEARRQLSMGDGRESLFSLTLPCLLTPTLFSHTGTRAAGLAVYEAAFRGRRLVGE